MTGNDTYLLPVDMKWAVGCNRWSASRILCVRVCQMESEKETEGGREKGKRGRKKERDIPKGTVYPRCVRMVEEVGDDEERRDIIYC